MKHYWYVKDLYDEVWKDRHCALFYVGCNSVRVKGDQLDKWQRDMSYNIPRFSVAQPPRWDLDRLIVEVSRSHIIGRTHPLRLLWTSKQPFSLHYTEQTQETNIHVLSGIRTRDPSYQAAVDLCIRQRGRSDGQRIIKLHNY